MWFVIALLALVAGLIVTAAVIDLKAWRRRVRYDVDPASVRDHRRDTDARLGFHDRSLGGGGF